MSVYDLQREKLLLHKLANGDEMAFRTIYDTYKHRIFTFVHAKADADFAHHRARLYQ